MNKLFRTIFATAGSACLVLLSSCSDTVDSVETEVHKSSDPVTKKFLSRLPYIDITSDSGVNFSHQPFLSGQFYMPEIMGSGVAVFDYDNDGDLDLYVVQGAPFERSENMPSDRLYQNSYAQSGQLSFTDVTDIANISAQGYGMGVAAADYNLDGHTDLLVTNYGGNQLWRNNGDGTFEDVTQQSGIAGNDWSSSAAFLDYDGDGDADLFIANYVNFKLDQNYTCASEGGQADYCGPQTYRSIPDQLFENVGAGKFKEVSQSIGVGRAYGPGLGIAISDFDNNGFDDVYVANDGEPNQLWMNSGHGAFTDNGLMSGTALNADGASEAGMGVTAADVDNDGDDDLFMTHLIAETNTLYINSGNGQFYDATSEFNLAASSIAMTGFGASWLDFDQDGWLDLIVANGNVKLETSRVALSDYPFEQRNQLFRNMGNQDSKGAAIKFADVSAEVPAIFEPLEVSRGVAIGDLDNDCFDDVIISNNNGPLRILHNQLEATSWIGLELKDPNNQFIEGAKAALTDNTKRLKTVRRSGSYLSAHDPRVCFVLDQMGDNGVDPSVTISWPNGDQEQWSNLATNQYHVLLRGQGQSMTSGRLKP